MGDLSWERSAAIVIGVPGTVGSRITQARIVFRVEKTARSSANTATVTAYNLGEANRKRLQTKGSVVAIEAGYGTVRQLVFSGAVLTGKCKWEPPDWISEAECLDGYEAMRAAQFARSWPVGTPRTQVVNELIAALGVSTGAVEASPLIGVLTAPLCVAASVRRTLDILGVAWGFSWSIQDGAIEIRTMGTKTAGAAMAILLTPTTGLIGSPEWSGDGLNVRALLNPGIRPGGYVRVESRVIKGTYRVQKSTHTGDTHGQEWYTEAVCQEVV